MARISGTRLIMVPCCGLLYSTPAYASINFTAHEHWTDGMVVGGLFDNGSGLRRCECGEVFLLRDAKQVGSIPKGKPQAPNGWERKSSSWWHRLWGLPTTEQIIKDYDIRSDEEIAAAQASTPPSPKFVRDDQLQALLEKKQKPEIELRLRRLYWRYLNDNYRTALKTSPTLKRPVFKPTPDQIENMRILATLIEANDNMNVVELVEIYRELGEFKKAQVLLPLLPEGYETEAALQKELLAEKCQAPTLIK